jgi:hypothetical protein
MNKNRPPRPSGIPSPMPSGMSSPHVRLLSRAEQSRDESSALPYGEYITLVKGISRATRFGLNTAGQANADTRPTVGCSIGVAI